MSPVAGTASKEAIVEEHVIIVEAEAWLRSC